MKKRKKKMWAIKFFSVIGLALLVLMKIANDDQLLEKKEKVLLLTDPYSKVNEYKPMIRKELEKYDIDKHTDVLLALMQQESKGLGGDPMQASESAGLPPNTIDDPEESVRQGVKHFKNVLQYGENKNVDFSTVIQSYNMGKGYIDFVHEHGGKHSEDLAKKFSLIQVKKDPDVYDCGGNKDNFRYPYCYGDFTYHTKVANNLKHFASAEQEEVSVAE
ncbi:lysozyme family protein [Pueribacillus theae]|nr:lysozyme family protein [Pueribacillus theae]